LDIKVSPNHHPSFNENSPIKEIAIMWLYLWDSSPTPEEMWQIPVGTKRF